MSDTTPDRPVYKPTDLLTREQTAEHLGISVSRLAQLRRAGEISYQKNERTRVIRFLFAEVERVRRERQLTDVPMSDAVTGA